MYMQQESKDGLNVSSFYVPQSHTNKMELSNEAKDKTCLQHNNGWESNAGPEIGRQEQSLRYKGKGC